MEVIYNETSTVSTEISVNINPTDYLWCDTKEEVFDNIIADIQDELDYGDFMCDDCLDNSVSIPDEFWEEWEKLKQEND